MPCGSGSKKKKDVFQKVIIPKGMVNPTETTIIEIPMALQKQPVVVAKRKHHSKKGEEDGFFRENESPRSRSREPPYPVGAAAAGAPPASAAASFCEPVCAQRPIAPPPPPPPPPLRPPPFKLPEFSPVPYKESSYRVGGVCAPQPTYRSHSPPSAFYPENSYRYRPQHQLVYHQVPPQQMYAPPASTSRYNESYNYSYPDPKILAETELQELQLLKQDLEDFQRARRKLLASTSNLAARSRTVHPSQFTSTSTRPPSPPPQPYMPSPPLQPYMPSPSPQPYMPQPPPQSYIPQPSPQIYVRAPTPAPLQSQQQPQEQQQPPTFTTRISTTKVVKTTQKANQTQKPSDHVQKNVSEENKFDTCGCLDL